MKKALYIVTFLAGLAVGAIAGITYIKRNYDISEKTEEDAEVPETSEEELEQEIEEDESEDLRNKYFNVTSVYGPGYDEVEIRDKPYKIMSDEFSQFEDYSAVELTLYSDGILADDRDEIVENAEELLGEDFREMFDEGSDELYIRNDERCCDYAILKDLHTYDDFEEERPHNTVED